MRNLFSIFSPLLIFSAFLFPWLVPSPGLAQIKQGDLSPLQILTNQNYRVLSGRVHKMLEARLTSFAGCRASDEQRLATAFKQLPAYSDERNVVIATLDLYLESYNVDPGCGKTLDRGEDQFFKAERSRFAIYRKVLNTICPLKPGTSTALVDRQCYVSISDLSADLEPHCVSLQVPNIGHKENDPFPCMVGDYMNAKSLITDMSWEKFLPKTQAFLQAFGIQAATHGTRKIDLFDLYKQGEKDSPQLREQFLALMNMFYSSSISSSSYIRGFHDYIWAFILFKKHDPAFALDYFVSSRIAVDTYRTYSDYAARHGIKLSFNQISMAGKIRHDYMAGYLACHYRDRTKQIREQVPELLGKAYESFDFETHIVNDHLSLKAAKENFVTDTGRYKTGVKWGENFCLMK